MSGLKALRAARQQNRVMSLAGFWTKNHCAVEGQQQFSCQSVSHIHRCRVVREKSMIMSPKNECAGEGQQQFTQTRNQIISTDSSCMTPRFLTLKNMVMSSAGSSSNLSEPTDRSDPSRTIPALDFSPNLNWTNQINYLKVILNSKLSDSPHISGPLCKANHKLRQMYPPLNKSSPTDINWALTTYKFLIGSLLKYAAPAWGYTAKTHINRLTVFQIKY
jgi:hypothetical protein